MYQTRRTKTFTETSWYRRPVGGDPTSWQAVPREQTNEVPLDQQIDDWISQTGSIIIHPGQLGIHTQWHDEQLTLKSVTLGLTVLYINPQEPIRVVTQQEPAVDYPTPSADPDFPGPSGLVAPGDIVQPERTG